MKGDREQTPVIILSDPADLDLLHRLYTFLRDLGRNGDIALNPSFPYGDYSDLYEAIGDRLYPDA